MSKKDKLRIAPLPEIPVISGSQPSTGITVIVKTKQVHIEKLMDKRYCRKEAKRMFEWFQQNLPYGIYQELFRQMKERYDFVEGTK